MRVEVDSEVLTVAEAATTHDDLRGKPMSKFGKKFTCWSCATKFYDLNKPNMKCPKCGADPSDDPKKDMPAAAPATYGDEYADEVETEVPEEPSEDDEGEDDAEAEVAPDDDY